MMRVLDLDRNEFEEACRRLEREVANSGYEFDTLVGIARGGDYVAENFIGGRRFSVNARRESTKFKSLGLVSKALSVLPRPIANILRIAESFFGSKFGGCRKTENGELEIGRELGEWLRGEQRRVLVVDDAVDSGRTLGRVVAALEREGREKGVEIRTAAIVQTRENADPKPDYSLYRQGILIRFPWAADAKG